MAGAGAPAACPATCNIGLPERDRASIELNMRHPGGDFLALNP